MTLGVDVPWTKMINPQLTAMKNHGLVLEQTPDVLHLNHNGDMHAGVIFSMLEMVGMGVVVIELGDQVDQYKVFVRNVNLDFVAPAKGKISFKAQLTQAAVESIKAAVLGKNKIKQCIGVEAIDKNGQKVAAAELTAVLVPR